MQDNSILIVDDNPMNLKLARFILEQEGYRVHVAADSAEAMAAVVKFSPQLILMDIQLPGMDGLELTRQIKSNPSTSHIAVLALTAYAMTGDEARARAAGCEGYITKPINTRTLPETVKQHLRTRAAAPTVHEGDYRDLLTEMRTGFLSQSAADVVHLLNTLTTDFSLDRTLRLVHRLGGIAGTLGFHDIGHKARAIEIFLESPAAGYIDAGVAKIGPSGELQSRLYASFLELHGAFEKALRRGNEMPDFPDAVLKLMACKRIVVTQFKPAEAARIAQVLEQAGSEVLVTEAIPRPEIVKTFDAFIVNVQEADVSPAFLAGRFTGTKGPVLFVGSTEVLLREWSHLERSSDFLSSPWDATEVVIRLYRLLSQDVSMRPVLESGSQHGPLTVLIADDDPLVTSLLSDALGKFGIQCFSAHDGNQAMELARSVLPNVVVLDVRMPGSDGFGVLQTLKRDPRTCGLHVLMLTSHNQEADMMRGFGLGADDYVTKPFNTIEVVARVTRFRTVPAVTSPLAG